VKTKKILIRTILISGCSVIINYLLTFILTPYITTNVGTDAYGYVSLSKTIVGYFELLTIALNSYATRYISVEYHRRNYEKANGYFNSVFFANIILGIIIFIIGTILSVSVNLIFDVNENIVTDIKLLFLLTFVNLLINCSSSAFSCAAYINNKLDIIGAAKCISKILQAAVVILLFFCAKPYVSYVGIGAVISAIIMAGANIYITIKYTNQIKIRGADFKLKYVKDLVVSGFWNSINSLGNILNTGLDLTISNLMLSAYSMGQLSIAKTFTALFSTIFQTLSQPFQPLFLKSYSDNNMDKLKLQMKYSMKLNGCFANIAVATIIVLGNEFLQLWLPKQDYMYIYILTVLTIITAVTEGPAFPLYYVYTLTIKNKIPCIITIIGGMLNVAGMYVLLKFTNLGLISVVVTTAVIMSFINFVTNPIYVCKCLKMKWTSFYPFLIRHVLSLVVLVACMRFVINIIKPVSWGMLVVKGSICVVIGVVIYIICVVEKDDLELIRRKSLR